MPKGGSVLPAISFQKRPGELNARELVANFQIHPTAIQK